MGRVWAIADGKLDAGIKFTQICMKIVEIISRAFFPFLSRKINGQYDDMWI